MPSLLITGPPASGKTRAALERFLADSSSLLLTPTTTMAEHVRNELARAHLPVRPHRILTLAKFLAPFTPFQDASESLLHLLIAQCNLSSFGPAARFPGFHRMLASRLQEVPLPADLVSIASDVEDRLAHRNRALRDQRLRTAQPVATGPVILDGFFTFSPSELDLIENLAGQTSVTVALPDWPGSESARVRLLAAGFTEQRFEVPLRNPVRTVFAAPSLEQEVEQIALRILDQSARGREFREMGVLLRVRDPYADALEAIFARFGIPARFHFAAAPSSHPAIQYLSGIVRAFLGGWSHADLLPLLRMPVSGIGATPGGDLLDFEMRESLPSRGAGKLGWVGQALSPATGPAVSPAEWSARLKTLRDLIPPPEITDRIDHDQLTIWRSTAAALNAFEVALDTTALALDDTELSLQEFWPSVEAALAAEKLRVPDRRRNVVNVIDVYEARQWELPIAFVCGLTERHFPQYHREPDRQEEEKFLFDLAITRATEQTILSYARFNDKGDPQLRSFFLEQPGEPSTSTRILPKPVGQGHALPNQSPPLDLRTQHTKLSPTSIESFLQCPFQFFARKTLKLRRRPAKPRDRLDNLLEGNILHRALAEGSLNEVFEDECRQKNIPRTYRTEAVRLELQRHFEAFQSDRQWTLTWPSRTEEMFEAALTPELAIRGRIDRLDLGPGQEAIVIDYKYSAAAKIRERIESDPIQGGLYLSAAARVFNLQPVGMFYCGLRQSVTWDGWHTNIPGLNLGEARTSLQELIDRAEQKAIGVFESIASGNIAVRPADKRKCQYCDYRDICRVESIPKAASALSNPLADARGYNPVPSGRG
jgi:ATP-dependent helicase/DNAse subunit B